MRISEETIRRIKYVANIEEVVGDFVSLKRKGSGANLWACCPFHNEKSPSFSVNPAKGIYKCFGCGKAGDSVGFVMEIEGLSYPEALRYLANKYNIEVEEDRFDPEQLAQRSQREAILIALNFAKNFYQTTLHEHETGRGLGLAYFKERGFTEASVATFELGFSLPEWHGLEQAAVQKGYSPEVLEKAGLLVTKADDAPGAPTKRYDRFRGRVMFPIHDLAGKVIGFGARTMKSGEQPKYLNSPETEVYHKSEVLYGIFQAKNAIRQADNCYLCEGYTDVISLHQAGVANAVASSGTSLTEGQIRLIKRFTQAVTVLYDGDPAGIKASLRGIDLLLAEGLSVRALLFPSGEDPDSYARKVGPAAFKDFLAAQAQDFLTFKTQLLLQDAAHDPIRRAGVVRDVVGSISKIPDAIQREVFVKQCARLLDVGEETLVLEINKLIISGQQKENERLAQAKERARAIKNPGRRAEGPPSEGPPPPTDEYAPLPTDEYAPPEAPWPDEIPLPDGVMLAGFGPKITRIVEQYEQACVRLLLRFGNHHVDLAADIKLWQYLFQELEDIEFHTPVYRNLLEMYKNAILQGLEPTAAWFIQNGPPDLVTKVVNLTEDKWQVSERWQQHEIYIPKETDHLLDVAHDSVVRLKKQFIEQLEQEILAEMRQAEAQPDDEAVLRLLTHYQHLCQQRVALAKPLGSVVSAR